jgi:alkylation response protein AidB-like acyl-CoA dehydrogenase
MTGGAEFNDVFFTDAVVADDDRIGGVGEGWGVAVTTLMNERVTIATRRQARTDRPIDRALELWRRHRGRDPIQRTRLACLWAESEVLRLTNARAERSRSIGTPGPEGSIGKLFGAEHGKKVANFAETLLGAEGLLHPGYHGESERTGAVQAAFVGSPSGTIAGGSSEIMRNIIGERALGLPGDIRVDRDIPWSEVPRS